MEIIWIHYFETERRASPAGQEEATDLKKVTNFSPAQDFEKSQRPHGQKCKRLLYLGKCINSSQAPKLFSISGNIFRTRKYNRKRRINPAGNINKKVPNFIETQFLLSASSFVAALFLTRYMKPGTASSNSLKSWRNTYETKANTFTPIEILMRSLFDGFFLTFVFPSSAMYVMYQFGSV